MRKQFKHLFRVSPWFLLSGLLFNPGCALLDRPDMDIYQPYIRQPQTSPESGKGLRVTHFGTSNLLFDDGETQLMVDAFFTRPSDWGQLFLGQISSNLPLIERILQEHKIDRLAAMLIFHSHYDHAMDLGPIALKTGAEVLGSESTAQIARGADLPEAQIRVVEPGKSYRYGQFEVTFFISKHTALPFWAEAMGLMGDITEPLRQPVSLFAYREGETYTIHIRHPLGTALVKGAALIPGELKGYSADKVFLCTPGLNQMGPDQQTQFFREIILDTGVKEVIPVHWDDFSLPLQAKLTPMPKTADNLDASLDFVFKQVQQHPEIKIQFIPALEPILLYKDPLEKQF